MEEITQPTTELNTNDMPKGPLEEKQVSKKIVWILLFIIFTLLVGIVYLYIKGNKVRDSLDVEENKTIEEESEVEDIDKEEYVIEDTEEDEDAFEYNFPDGYTVVKESCTTQNNLGSTDCVEVYKIQPDNYTVLEKKYLLNASVSVFSKPNDIKLQGQTSQTRYDSQLRKWVFDEGQPEVLPEKTVNSNIIVETFQGGSQVGWDYIIISKSSISTLLIVSIPKYQRIQCDYIEDKTEKMECERFLVSLNPEDEGWLPDSIYQTKYSDLRSNVSTLW